ncbi:MAG: hypothetical protein NZM29_06000, partial [Nitrospira sp.]|nr:hypothetical protein [Nitrospira sp.]
MQEWNTLERLTEAAYVAALKGEWNVVEACYRQRETVLKESEVTDAVLARVQAMDQEIAERAKVAQAAVT